MHFDILSPCTYGAVTAVHLVTATFVQRRNRLAEFFIIYKPEISFYLSLSVLCRSSYTPAATLGLLQQCDLLVMAIGCRRGVLGVYILGQGQFRPQLTTSQFLTTRRCFRLSRELRANPHYLQKYSPWSTNFARSLQSRTFWRGALYATVLFGGITSYFYYVSA
jgi:hypothetical protein